MALSIDTVIDYYFFILILCFSDLSFRETGGEVAKERVQQDKRIDVLHSIAYIFFLAFSDDNTIGDTAKTVKAPLGIEVLFATFKEWGYQSLYQEDLCWYDTWGIGLTGLEIKRIPDGHEEFRERYGFS